VTQEKARALPSPGDNEELTQVTRKLEKFHVVDR
jgi:hypothetical protein